DRALAKSGLRGADLSARRDGENHKLLRSARHCAWRVAARARRHQGQSRRHDHDLPAFGVKRSVDAALSRPRCRFRLGLDAGARPRPPAGRRVAAGDLRPCRLGWTDRHHRGDRGGGDLGHPWPGGCADPLVRLAGVEGAAARHRRLRRRGRRRRRRSHTMNRFAELLDRLAYEPSRNSKLRLMIDYFRSTGDPERGWALAALTGGLSFPHAQAGLIRSLIAERTHPVPFQLSYRYLGDLSETVALMWPAKQAHVAIAPNQQGGEEEDKLTLTDVVDTLARLGKAQLPQQLARWLDALDETGRWALIKLVTGGLRVGVSARLAQGALAGRPHQDGPGPRGVRAAAARAL